MSCLCQLYNTRHLAMFCDRNGWGLHYIVLILLIFVWECIVSRAMSCTHVHFREMNQTCCCVREAAETMALLDAILEGLADGQNGALRDLCAAATRGTQLSLQYIPVERHAVYVIIPISLIVPNLQPRHEDV